MASFTLRPLKLCLLLFEIIPSVDSTGGTVWAVFIVVVVIVAILDVLGKRELVKIYTQFC